MFVDLFVTCDGNGGKCLKMSSSLEFSARGAAKVAGFRE
jgi:hypothetical protein